MFSNNILIFPLSPLFYDIGGNSQFLTIQGRNMFISWISLDARAFCHEISSTIINEPNGIK